MMMYKKISILFFLSLFSIALKAQISVGGNDSTNVNVSSAQEYEIAGISVSGADHLDQNVLILLSGLSVGDKIKTPSDKISTAIDVIC